MKALATLFVSALTVVGVAGAAAQEPTTYKLTATLTTSAEEPKPIRGEARHARHVHRDGRAAIVAIRAGFPHVEAHLHEAHRPRTQGAHPPVHSRGGPGKVLFALCYPCRNGHSGKGTTSRQYFKLIRAGKAYVNVHTTERNSGR